MAPKNPGGSPKHTTSRKKPAPRRAAKKAAAKKVQKLRAPPKPARSRHPDAVVTPDKRRQAQTTARKTFAQPRIDHFVEAAAVTGSIMRAVQVSEGSVSHQEATRLMQDPSVITAIAQKRQSLAAAAGITSEKIMREYASMGFSNMRDYSDLLVTDSITEGLSGLSLEQSAAIQELTTEMFWDDVDKRNVKRVKLKLYPKEVALDKMAKHLGIKGFGGALNGAASKIGMQTEVLPDGTVRVQAVLEHLPDEELERIVAGEEDLMSYDERSE